MLLSRDGNAEASTSRRGQSSTNHPPSRVLSAPAHHVNPDPDAHTPYSTPGHATSLSVSHHRVSTPPFSLSSGTTASPPAPFLLLSPAESSPSSGGSPHPHFLSIHIPRKFHSMTAGAGAGLVSSIVTCPLDVIKTRLQAQHLARDSQDYEGVRLTILRIWRQSGLRGFYRGLGPTLGGYLPTWGIYFTVYDLVKDRLGGIARESGEWVRAGTSRVGSNGVGSSGVWSSRVESSRLGSSRLGSSWVYLGRIIGCVFRCGCRTETRGARIIRDLGGIESRAEGQGAVTAVLMDCLVVGTTHNSRLTTRDSRLATHDSSLTRIIF